MVVAGGCDRVDGIMRTDPADRQSGKERAGMRASLQRPGASSVPRAAVSKAALNTATAGAGGGRVEARHREAAFALRA